MSDKKSVWETLSVLDVSSYTRKKNGMTYLSWAHAWKALKDSYPSATFNKHLQEDGMPYILDANGFAYVTVTVMAGGESATELFPVLDYRNKSIQNPNAFDVNTAHQRAMTKAMAYLGLGHYIYAGEDLPPDNPVEAIQAPVDKQVTDRAPDTAKPEEPKPSTPKIDPDAPIGTMVNTFAYRPQDKEPRAFHQWDLWADVSCSWVDSAKTTNQLEVFFKKNKPVFDAAKVHAADDLAKVMTALKAKKASILEKGK